MPSVRRRTSPRLSEAELTEPLARRVAAEALGTGLLLATVVGSGIMGDKLAGGNDAIARTMSDTFAGIRPADTPGFVLAQVAGAAAALALASWLFPRPDRSGD